MNYAEGTWAYCYMVIDGLNVESYCGLIKAISRAEAHGLVAMMAARLCPGKRISVKIGLPYPNCVIDDIDTATITKS